MTSLQLAKLPYLPDTHVSIADDIGLRTGKAWLLKVARCLHPFADRLGRFAHPIPT